MRVDLSLSRRRNVLLLSSLLEADGSDADHQAPTDMLNDVRLALPRDERELMIAANNGHLLAFDTCPACPPGSRTHCAGLRAAAVSRSGSPTPMMQPYTNDEEVLFKAARPARRFRPRSLVLAHQ
jgi:hypothetical protein